MDKVTALNLILASKSPVRRLLLTNAGLSFQTVPAAIFEGEFIKSEQTKNTTPSHIASGLAVQKAQAVSKDYPQAIVIGADQILDLEGEIFSKPENMDAALAHLEKLRGKTHTLSSAVCLVKNGDVLWHHVSQVQLTMRDFSTLELEALLAEEREALLSSVGAYRFEGLAIQLFSQIDGDYFAILGLPLLPLLAALRDHAPQHLLGAQL